MLVNAWFTLPEKFSLLPAVDKTGDGVTLHPSRSSWITGKEGGLLVPKYLLNLVVEFAIEITLTACEHTVYMFCLVGQPFNHKVIPSFLMVPKWFYFLIKLSDLVISGCL